MTTINLGKVRPVYQGAWSATATYEAYDFVIYNGSCYLALQDVPANYIPTSQTAYWVLFGAKGDQGVKGDDGDPGPRGLQGPKGDVFTPTVSSAGVLSWTNDGGLDNPTPVNIKGPKGDDGEKGQQGIQGVQGPPGTTDYTQLTNKPQSDTSLTVQGGFADAKATGEALAKKVGVTSQTFTEAEQTQARTNMGLVQTFFNKAVEAYLTPIVKDLILDNGGTQAEIDAIESANQNQTS